MLGSGGDPFSLVSPFSHATILREGMWPIKQRSLHFDLSSRTLSLSIYVPVSSRKIDPKLCDLAIEKWSLAPPAAFRTETEPREDMTDASPNPSFWVYKPVCALWDGRIVKPPPGKHSVKKRPSCGPSGFSLSPLVRRCILAANPACSIQAKIPFQPDTLPGSGPLTSVSTARLFPRHV